MNYYLDITIQPDAEMRENWLLNKTYTKLHKRLNELNATDIGISFPNYKTKLGKIIRVHGTQPRLTELQNSHWLGGLSGYCKVTNILSIPPHVKYRILCRKQTNKSQSKLKRLIKKGSIPPEKIKAYKANIYQESLDNAYLELQSTSSGQKYRLFIDFGKLIEQPIQGQFNQFGLSKIATIPWF